MIYEIKKDSGRLVREEQKIYDARGEGILVRKRKRFRLIDVFAGAGGMTLGFSKMFGHAFDSVWANDFNADCVRTYRTNFGDHCVSGDIVDILNDPATEIPAADVVIGGPPCQGFSLLNKNREGDPRKQLWRPYLEIVEGQGHRCLSWRTCPSSWARSSMARSWARRKRWASSAGVKCCRAADYGVPQTRRRAFIVGCKFFDPAQVFPPRKTHFDPRKGGAQTTLLKQTTTDICPVP